MVLPPAGDGIHRFKNKQDHLIVGSSESAYTYALNGGSFTQIAELTPEDGTEETVFGMTVAIDGKFAAVSDRYAEAVYLYEHVGTDWVEVAKFRGSDWPDYGGGFTFGRAIVLHNQRLLISGQGMSYSYAW